MAFDELEVGKEYCKIGTTMASRVIAKNATQVVFQGLTSRLFWTEQWSAGDAVNWRPYTPPPEPVVRYVFARRMSGMDTPCAGIFQVEANAEADIYRIGPVVRVELPTDPDMLARVRDGAK